MKVFFSTKVKKSVESMPMAEQEKFFHPVKDIELNGLIRNNWPHYGILKGLKTHHCHLSYRYEPCWFETEKGFKVEVSYECHRGSAPYAKH